MTDQVLVAMDDSEMAERALEYALDTYPDADITVFHVVGEPSPWMGKAMSIAIEDDLEAAKRSHAEAVLEKAHTIANEYDHEIDTDVGMGSPAKAIVSRAEGFDHVVIGSHGGSLVDRLLVGNVAETVFRRAPAPVTVVR
ncbi:universal stress protein [Halorhabdus amylolytica]|uniref:universal stress protein n=1 Tax=Halorhabdus amylolytica TaxID=2559573 RepID=UPI0010AAEA9F|nr:universal stress protein [Halorhabdus amylolytica]